jgi:LysR family transcriptional regulator, transcriptional activator for dmlA
MTLPALHSDDLVLLDRIATAGSLAGAARSLELAPPAVSKRLAALEARLGLRLVQRSTRQLRLTADGELAVSEGRLLLQGLDRLSEVLAERAGQVQGGVRLASTFGFGRAVLAPLLARFQDLHPTVQVTLLLSEQLPELGSPGARRIDAAVWLFPLRQEQLVTRKLAANRRLLVAAPGYLARAGRPEQPADLARHECLVVRENDGPPAVWHLQSSRRSRTAHTVRVQGRLSSNFGEVVRDWCLAGRGVMLRSEWEVRPLVAAGRLVQLLPEWSQADADVRFVTPPRDALSPTPLRVRQLRDFLAAALARVDWSRPQSLHA